MKQVILSCPTLKKEIQHLLAEYKLDMPVYFLPKRLHSDPKELAEYLQNTIDSFYNVDRILICVSGCGGGTAKLKATTAELVVPKTRDCVDILLSKTDRASIDRAHNGIFMTESWLDFMQSGELNLERQIAEKGEEEGKAWLRKMFKGFEHFYVVDTGTYDTQVVIDALKPLVEVLDGTIETVPGGYNILRKLITGDIDGDFRVIPKEG